MLLPSLGGGVRSVSFRGLSDLLEKGSPFLIQLVELLPMSLKSSFWASFSTLLDPVKLFEEISRRYLKKTEVSPH